MATHIITSDPIVDGTGIMTGTPLAPVISATAAKTAMGLSTAASDISTLQSTVSTNTTNISSNTSAISTLQTQMAAQNPLFVQITDKTVTNTISETSIIGTGTGSTTLSAGFFNTAGKVLRVKLAGIYSTPAIVSSSVLIKIKLGSTVLASGTTTALAVGASSLRFFGEANIICRTSGVSGVLAIDCAIIYNVAATDVPVQDPLNNGGSTITSIDLTGSLVFDVTATWDSNTTTRIAKSTVCTIEQLN